MLYLIRSDDPEMTSKALKATGAKNIVVSKNNESIPLLEWVANKLVFRRQVTVIVISTKGNWESLESLALECGHNTTRLAPFTPENN